MFGWTKAKVRADPIRSVSIETAKRLFAFTSFAATQQTSACRQHRAENYAFTRKQGDTNHTYEMSLRAMKMISPNTGKENTENAESRGGERKKNTSRNDIWCSFHYRLVRPIRNRKRSNNTLNKEIRRKNKTNRLKRRAREKVLSRNGAIDFRRSTLSERNAEGRGRRRRAENAEQIKLVFISIRLCIKQEHKHSDTAHGIRTG